jgi:inhibitor of cysteine peptidase
MKVRYSVVVLILAMLSLVAAGCSAAQEMSTPVPGVSTSTPVSGDQEGKVITGKARVEEIEIMILESFPVQINVVARGNLPDGCTTIDRIEQERQGNTVLVTITTVRPADQACTEALVPFEEVISLDAAGLAAGTYTVDVNGVRDTFELAVDNSLPDEGRVPGAPGDGEGAIVDDVSVAIDEEDPSLL